MNKKEGDLSVRMGKDIIANPPINPAIIQYQQPNR